MSHAAAETCTQRLAAGRGHRYRLAAATASTAQVQHWQWSSLLNVNDDQSVQRDKPLAGSKGKAPTPFQRQRIYQGYEDMAKIKSI